jgi:hypothetical protein
MHCRDIELADVCEEADMTVEGVAQPRQGSLADEDDLASLAPAKHTQNAADAAMDDLTIIASTVSKHQCAIASYHPFPIPNSFFLSV